MSTRRRNCTSCDDGGYDADARLDLEDFRAQTGIDSCAAKMRRKKSIRWAGWSCRCWAACPSAAKSFPIPSGFEFEVLEADPRRVKRLRLRPVAGVRAARSRPMTESAELRGGSIPRWRAAGACVRAQHGVAALDAAHSAPALISALCVCAVRILSPAAGRARDLRSSDRRRARPRRIPGPVRPGQDGGWASGSFCRPLLGRLCVSRRCGCACLADSVRGSAPAWGLALFFAARPGGVCAVWWRPGAVAHFSVRTAFIPSPNGCAAMC